MGAKGEALAKQFETKAQEAAAVLEKLSDADWKKVTEGEKWSVGVTAHHVAGSHEAIAGIIQTVASGGKMPEGFTLDALHQMNAKHAQDFASVGKAETIALHKKGAATAAAAVRSLSDEQLTKTGTVLGGVPPMSVEQIVTGILINHIDDHFGSIKKTVGA
jgi:hypothetical protein